MGNKLPSATARESRVVRTVFLFELVALLLGSILFFSHQIALQ
ncbi:MAG: hypothetical protein PHQ40_15265 [Anaerolineaceae bacterium]|nr:hypothetical protein [Anaerolineaceae bacterium]